MDPLDRLLVDCQDRLVPGIPYEVKAHCRQLTDWGSEVETSEMWVLHLPGERTFALVGDTSTPDAPRLRSAWDLHLSPEAADLYAAYVNLWDRVLGGTNDPDGPGATDLRDQIRGLSRHPLAH